MARSDDVERRADDPATVVHLIYRIVDKPHRARALVLILRPVLRACVLIAALALAFTSLHCPGAWSGGGMGTLGLTWFSWPVMRRVQRRRRRGRR